MGSYFFPFLIYLCGASAANIQERMKRSDLTQEWKAIWAEAKLLKDLQYTEICTKNRNF